MKMSLSGLFVYMIVMLFLLMSCNMVVGKQIPITGDEVSDVPRMTEEPNLMQTPTDVPFEPLPTQAPSITPLLVTETDIADSTLTPSLPTRTPTVVFPSQTAKSFTNSIAVYLPNLSGSFNVRTGTSLTITNKGTDGKSYTCYISQLGKVIVRRYIPGDHRASNSFSLSRGEYKLNCGHPNLNATIFSE